ncbi:MAG: ABC transporter substrate-binding protein [Armatimonadota bacterium]|nr:ABC transporter substrate-binding protein [Armatimonadota bacterium]MDR7448121.1 ABC transporter substrate-binding protein [Armatimonadota bacterium]MDR7460453.1 ABC transporter substrate-binding protein [Armatimonadota bacterium]MDR7478267.1 ABC transporter substrate-binding protein [Armatimonadota bacterium]MDR7487290.1 ABC transporter substrate-binding protein [Armatimonadota bacterium]
MVHRVAHRLLRGAVLAALVLATTTLAFAQAPARPARPVTWKFTLDFLLQGPQAPFLVALEKGYFAREGVHLTIDRGFGSADAVAKIAGGAYDLGYADINTMIEFNVRNPGKELVAFVMVLNAPPFAILTLRRENIRTPQDLVGKRLGAPAGDAPRRLFPVFARAVGIHPDSVEWVTMDVPLREPSLIRGSVNAITGFYFTAFINLKATGVRPEDIVAFLYSDYGLPLYGNAVMAPRALLEREPAAVRGFVRAFIRGVADSIASPQEAVALLKRRDPLLNEAVEQERLLLALRANILTREVQADGFGGVRPERLARAIDAVALAFGLPTKPTWYEVFTPRFLPPKKDRMLPPLR